MAGVSDPLSFHRVTIVYLGNMNGRDMLERAASTPPKSKCQVPGPFFITVPMFLRYKTKKTYALMLIHNDATFKSFCSKLPDSYTAVQFRIFNTRMHRSTNSLTTTVNI